MRSFDRAGLFAVLDTYLETRHRGGDMHALLAPEVQLSENGSAAVDAGFWTAANPTAYRLAFADEACAEVGCHATFVENDVVGIYAVHLRLDPVGRIVQAEHLIARKGDSNAFAAHRLIAPDPLFGRVEPQPTRQSRAQLVAAADSYFDAVEKSDGAGVPIAERCDRIENGLRTTNNPAAGLPWNCREGMRIFGYIDRVRDRRYPLVDEARGLVWASAALEVPSGSMLRLAVDGQEIARPQAERSIFLSELFKIVDGEITAIDVVVRNMPKGAGFGLT